MSAPMPPPSKPSAPLPGTIICVFATFLLLACHGFGGLAHGPSTSEIKCRIVGATPIADRLLGKPCSRTPVEVEQSKYERQFEIEHWMAQHAPGRQWLALDDDERLFAPNCPNLVLVDPRMGIRPGTMFRLTKVTNNFLGRLPECDRPNSATASTSSMRP